MKKTILILLFSAFVYNTFATPPLPPIGKRWVLNEDYSDEFNGTSLDNFKWYDYHPTWKGRSPGLFMASQVKVADGYLSIKGEKMTKDTVVNGETYNIKCGAVISKKQTAFFGYYECRLKASKTSLSTTFWFSNRNKFNGPKGCGDKYSQEWDIQECIGRAGNFQGSWFSAGMHSNAHYWYTDCSSVNTDNRAPEVRFESNELASANFNTYGGWWKDENTASYYFNNGTEKSHSFYNAISPKPFPNPMGMNLVCETYPYPWIELPTDAELSDPQKNTCYYDWVRAYTLVDAAEVINKNLVANGDLETGDLTNWSKWGTPGPTVVSDPQNVYSGKYAVRIIGPGAPEYLLTLKPNTNYKLNCYAKAITGSITFGLKSNSTSVVVVSAEVTGDEYKKYSLSFNSGTYSDLKFYLYAQASEEGYADDFELVEVDNTTALIALYDENIRLNKAVNQLLASKLLNFQYTYMANEDRSLHLELRDPNDQIIKDTVITLYAGYANTSVNLSLSTIPTPKNGYKLTAILRPLNSTDTDKISVDESVFSVLTGIPQISSKDAFKIFPNPFYDNLNIIGLKKNMNFKIRNLLGEVVLEDVINNEEIRLGSLQSGTYILETNGGNFVILKI